MIRPCEKFILDASSRISPSIAPVLRRQQEGFPEMISTLKIWLPLATTIFMVVTPAYSQAPTDAQRSAIRSACRSDYEAHCASVPPGGMESLQCLQKNMSSLAPSCQTVVRAVEPAAEPKAEAKPEAKPESAPAAAAPQTETTT